MEQDLNISDLVRWFDCDPHGIVIGSSLGIIINRGDHKFKGDLDDCSEFAATADYIAWIKDQYWVYLFDRKDYIWTYAAELELINSNKEPCISS